MSVYQAAVPAVGPGNAGYRSASCSAALVVVGLSAERAAKEAQIRDMIRVGHRAGASLRQLAEVAGLDRKTVIAIVGPRSAVRSERPYGGAAAGVFTPVRASQ